MTTVDGYGTLFDRFTGQDARPATRAGSVRDAGRGWLIAGLLAALALGLAPLAATNAKAIDPELLLLLRLMGVIKLSMAFLAAGLLWWRLGEPLSAGLAWLARVAVCVQVSTACLILGVTWVAPAAFAFHVALAALILVACLDRPSRRASIDR
ncbi:MAG: hypothetical protein V2I63_10645 [Pseudomonadales bacterium]|jgi:hypothetical protein|nr:hypothetical protein [Pseudomonadales bacterium]